MQPANTSGSGLIPVAVTINSAENPATYLVRSCSMQLNPTPRLDRVSQANGGLKHSVSEYHLSRGNHPYLDTDPSILLEPRKKDSCFRRLKNRFSVSHKRRPNCRRRLNRLLYILRIFLTHLFSTTGLCFLVVVYSCLGATIFVFLEAQNEIQVRSNMEMERVKCASELWNQTLTLNVLYPQEWNQMAIERILAFEQKIIDAVHNDGYGSSVEQWSFSGALLYSVTVITTIGYGNVTCKTDWGRIATILYAIIGIPITFLCLANLGNLMAETFRFSYRKICCCRFGKKSTPNLKPDVEIQLNSLKMPEDTEIQSGNGIRAKQQVEENQQATELVSNLLKLTCAIHSDSDGSEDGLKLNDDISLGLDKEKKERVPIWLVSCLVIGYIILGAFMFSIWEEWGPIEGAYFCFITLTTIGFGDMVPGSAKFSYHKDGQTKFIICCVYMMVGLSLIAMSFNLVQEEIVIKCRSIGRRLGIMPNVGRKFNYLHKKHKRNKLTR